MNDHDIGVAVPRCRPGNPIVQAFRACGERRSLGPACRRTASGSGHVEGLPVDVNVEALMSPQIGEQSKLRSAIEADAQRVPLQPTDGDDALFQKLHKTAALRTKIRARCSSDRSVRAMECEPCLDLDDATCLPTWAIERNGRHAPLEIEAH